jgi:hypothetical protein
MLTGEKARTMRAEVIDTSLDVVATLSELGVGNLSRYERGAANIFSAEALARLEQTLNGLIKVRKKFQSQGVPVDMNDIRFLRKQLREQGRKNPPAEIVQVWGLAFIVAFCALAKITAAEFLSMAQLSPRLARAEVFSTICQRWCAAWAAGIERELRRENIDATFDNYVERFESRQAALEALARTVFDGLLAECGKEKIKEYMAALLITNELAKAPRDVTEN